ncbi:hypothetical protein [Streptomyces koyangensis]|uniref:hypothetical protein n=1 Tax=Streptomyces koyangensis TaxID=188770 RepID=UPI003BF60396
MNRRTLPALTALATATVLLLTACGGESAKPDEKIPGAGESSAKASASPSEGAAEEIDRPEIKFPKDFRMTWESAEPAGADEKAALKDAQNYMEAINHAVVQQDPEDSVYKFYVVPLSQAQEYAKKTAKAIVDGGWTVTGVMHQSQINVKKTQNGKLVNVSFCQDESAAYAKEVRTGKVLKTEASEKSHYAYSVIMQESSSTDGLWQAKAVTATRGAAQCVGR